MPNIEIHIDEETSSFLLRGDVNELVANRRARFFLNDYLKADTSQVDKIVIPYQKSVDQDREKVLSQIQETLVKFNFSETRSETVSQVLEDYFIEEERFVEFSKKAKGIWNNDLDKNDFKHFTETLKQVMPQRRLYDLQLLAAYHLAFSQNACNFSVPGAGKTSIVYAAYAYLKTLSQDSKKYVNKLMVIGPLSSFGPWTDEFKECFNEDPDIQRISGGIAKEDRIQHFYSPFSAEITLISYQSLASNLDHVISYLRKHENKVMVVLDEAHKIKNTEGGTWATAVLNIAQYCKARVVLTGTPAPNGYEDIYNLYHFIWPDKDIIDFHLFQLKEMSGNNYDQRISQLTNNISPFFIRIKKSDLKKFMGLPDAIENPPIIIPMGPTQQKIYELIENSYIDYFQEDGQGEDFKNPLTRARLVRLMQVATNPALLHKPLDDYFNEYGLPDDIYTNDTNILKQIIDYDKLETPPKFVAVADLTEELLAKGERVIIWGTFIQNIKELKTYLETRNISSELLIGETPVEIDITIEGVKTREQIIKEFHDTASPFRVIIANPFAVAESISLHKACHNAIYLERNFNAATYIQSKDRIHRVGLMPTDKINYYYILTQGTIDETIHQRLLEKEANMLRIIESKDIPLINLNMDYEDDLKDDIKALIRDYVRKSSKNK